MVTTKVYVFVLVHKINRITEEYYWIWILWASYKWNIHCISRNSSNSNRHKRHIYSCRIWCLSYKEMFNKKVVIYIKCVLLFFLQHLSDIVLLLRIQWETITNVHKSSCKILVILARFWWNVSFLDRFSKNTQISLYNYYSNEMHTFFIIKITRYYNL
jgi:hypothetical protein